MRWFKHMTCSARDPKMAQLIAKHGAAGYGMYWMLLEAIAEQVDERGITDLTFPAKHWAKILGTYQGKHASIFLQSLADLSLISLTIDGDLLRVDMPNILKYRDEWSKKKSRNSGATPEQLRSIDPEADKEVDKEKEGKKTQSKEKAKSARAGEEQVPYQEPPSAAGPADAGSGKEPEYEFTFALLDGSTVGLIAKDLASWGKNYRAIDVRAELQAIADKTPEARGEKWTRKTWFQTLSAWLRATNKRALAENPGFDPDDPDGNKKAARDIADTKAMIARVHGGIHLTPVANPAPLLNPPPARARDAPGGIRELVKQLAEAKTT